MGPGPEIAAETRDEILAVVHALHLRSQVLVHLRLDGYTLHELAELTGWSLRTVERLWEGVCKRARFHGRKEGRKEGRRPSFPAMNEIAAVVVAHQGICARSAV